MQDEKGFLTFKGFAGGLIAWENSLGAWTLKSKNNRDTLCLFQKSLPIGVKLWTPCNTTESQIPDLAINFNACNDDEIGCNSGICIPLKLRCNQAYDCYEGEDEDNCSIINLPKGYNIKSPLPPHAKPLELSLYIKLYNLFGIDLSQSTLKIRYKIVFSWKDERLR